LGAAPAIPTIILTMAMDIAGLQVGSVRATQWPVLVLATPIQIILGRRYCRGTFTSLRPRGCGVLFR
jgi:hypothetical protein